MIPTPAMATIMRANCWPPWASALMTISGFRLIAGLMKLKGMRTNNATRPDPDGDNPLINAVTTVAIGTTIIIRLTTSWKTTAISAPISSGSVSTFSRQESNTTLAKRLAITPAGRCTFEETRPAAQIGRDSLLSPLKAKEQEQFLLYLRRILAARDPSLQEFLDDDWDAPESPRYKKVRKKTK